MGERDDESGRSRSRRRSDDERRQGSLRALSRSVDQITRQVLGRRALAEAGLIADWPSIVGREFAQACQPRRLTFPKRNERREGTLVLRVKPGEATRIAHLEPVLIDRVNGYFGYKAVARLRLEQGALVQREQPKRPPPPTFDPAESQAAEERVAGVADADLRAALERLGRRLSGKG